MSFLRTSRWKLSQLAWLGTGLTILLITWRIFLHMGDTDLGTLLEIGGMLLGLPITWAGLAGLFQAAPPTPISEPIERPPSPEQVQHARLRKYVFYDLFPQKRVYDERIITAAEVAQAMQLDEAIVREWLGSVNSGYYVWAWSIY